MAANIEQVEAKVVLVHPVIAEGITAQRGGGNEFPSG